jgi:hypothetical protein
MSRHSDRNRKHDSRLVEPEMTAEEWAEEILKARKRREWTARKLAHWQRMGTPADINPLTGAAAPKWKLDADKVRAKMLAKSGHRRTA